MTKIAIIGSGIAAHTLIKEIRKHTKEAEIRIYTEESGDYYYKPNLSTALSKQKTPSMLIMKSAAELCQEFNLILQPHTTITHCDPIKKLLHTRDTSYAYDQLIFATGATPIPLPPIPSQTTPFHPLSINRLEDYEKFRQELASAKRVVLIGAGLVACEFANDLIINGYQVDIITLNDSPLEYYVPKVLGDRLAEKLKILGVRWHFNNTVTAIDKTTAPYILTLQNGEALQADVVVSAIGLKPTIALAQQAQITCERGIIIDEGGHTSRPYHFALGDCAQFQGKVRLFVQPILPMARAIAENIFQENRAKIDLTMAPVMVKTPCFPIAALPPSPGIPVSWTIEEVDADFIALAYDKEKTLQGYVLTGQMRASHPRYTSAILKE
jgi:rubredoxin---NAD+ reductase